MNCYIAISCADEKEKVENFIQTVQKAYPDQESSYQVSDDSIIIVDDNVIMPKSLSEKFMDPNDKESLEEIGRHLIFKFERLYWGYHNQGLWQWLSDKGA